MCMYNIHVIYKYYIHSSYYCSKPSFDVFLLLKYRQHRNVIYVFVLMCLLLWNKMPSLQYETHLCLCLQYRYGCCKCNEHNLFNRHIVQNVYGFAVCCWIIWYAQICSETGSRVVDGLTGAQPKILSRVGKLPKSARDLSCCLRFP